MTTDAPTNSFALSPVRFRGFAVATGSAATVCPNTCPNVSANLANAAGIPSARTSIHCDSPRKYSSARLSGAASIRNAIIGLRLDAARSTSLLTCDEVTAFAESTNTSALASLIAPTMASAYRVPGFTSRGASQHLSPWCSRFSTMDLATAASCDA